MGAVAISEITELGGWEHGQGMRKKLAKITFSNSYATGGDTISLATLGYKRLLDMLEVSSAPTGASTISVFQGVRVAPASSTYGGRIELAGTPTVPLIKATKGGTTPVEETAATNLSTVSFYAVFIGEQA